MGPQGTSNRDALARAVKARVLDEVGARLCEPLKVEMVKRAAQFLVGETRDF